VCVAHGGRAPQVKAAAQRRVLARAAEADAAALVAQEGVSGVDDPLDVLARLAAEAVAMKDALASRVNALNELRYTAAGAGTEQLRAEVALYERALDRAAKFVEVMVRLDVEGRRVRVQEAYVVALGGVIDAILDGLALTAEQRRLVPTVVPAALELLDVDGAR